MKKRESSNEIRITRVYDAPVGAVWDAWTVPDQVAQWWGPRGFSLTTHHKDLRVGGTWRYTMHGPDGVDYPNVTTYFVVEPHQKLVYDHGATDTTPPLFRVTATFSERAGKTQLDLAFALATPEAAAEMAKFIKKAGGNATWDRLAEHLEEGATGTRTFVINRSLDAPVAQVFAMWTDPAKLLQWLPPKGVTMRFVRGEIAAGKSALVEMASPGGSMFARFEYLTIEPSSLIVYTQAFVDANEAPVAAPFGGPWPAQLRTTVRFAEEASDQTRVTVTSEPLGEASADELAAFVRERTGMTQGWTGSFDALEPLLELGEAPSPL